MFQNGEVSQGKSLYRTFKLEEVSYGRSLYKTFLMVRVYIERFKLRKFLSVCVYYRTFLRVVIYIKDVSEWKSLLRTRKIVMFLSFPCLERNWKSICAHQLVWRDLWSMWEYLLPESNSPQLSATSIFLYFSVSVYQF